MLKNLIVLCCVFLVFTFSWSQRIQVLSQNNGSISYGTLSVIDSNLNPKIIHLFDSTDFDKNGYLTKTELFHSFLNLPALLNFHFKNGGNNSHLFFFDTVLIQIDNSHLMKIKYKDSLYNYISELSSTSISPEQLLEQVINKFKKEYNIDKTKYLPVFHYILINMKLNKLLDAGTIRKLLKEYAGSSIYLLKLHQVVD